jgi:hypothetical protein
VADVLRRSTETAAVAFAGADSTSITRKLENIDFAAGIRLGHVGSIPITRSNSFRSRFWVIKDGPAQGIRSSD